MVIKYNYGFFYRINTPVDFLLVPLLFALLDKNALIKLNIGDKKKKIYFFVYSIALIIAMSRYIYFYVISLLLVYMLFFVSFKASLKKILCFSTVFSVVLVAIIFNVDVIYERYFGSYAELSDNVRYLLYPALLQGFFSAPIFGHGLGAYLNDYIVFENAPWNYVLLWMSFLNQFGLFGFIYLSLLFAFPVNQIKITHGLIISKRQMFYFFSYVLFLISGLFNTFLLSSSVSFMYFLHRYFVLSSLGCEIKRDLVCQK